MRHEELGRLRKVFTDLADALTDTEFRKLAVAVQPFEFDPGEKLVEQGKPASDLFWVTAGRLDVVVEVEGREKHIGTVGAGDIAGEINFLDPGPSEWTLVATTRGAALRLPAAELEAVVHTSPAIAGALLHQVIEAIAEKRRDQVRLLSCLSAELNDVASNSTYPGDRP
jgi:CRP-like cAMP-binding protein